MNYKIGLMLLWVLGFVLISCRTGRYKVKPAMTFYQSMNKDHRLIERVEGATIIRRGEVFILFVENALCSHLYHAESPFEKLSLSFFGFDPNNYDELRFVEKEYWEDRYESFLDLNDTLISTAILQKSFDVLEAHQMIGARYVESKENEILFYWDAESYFRYKKINGDSCSTDCVYVTPTWCYCQKNIEKKARLQRRVEGLMLP